MKITSIHIENFKSLVDVTIERPNPFTVFAGPNGSGKSNIFEAIEYRMFGQQNSEKVDISDNEGFLKDDLFPDILNFNKLEKLHFVNIGDSNFPVTGKPKITINFGSFKLLEFGGMLRFGAPTYDEKGTEHVFFPFEEQSQFLQFVTNHSEIYVDNFKREKIKIQSERKLSTACGNLEKVLKRLLDDDSTRSEIIQWLSLFVPELENVQVVKNDLSKKEDLIFYQKGYSQPFPRDLISNGTFNILALLVAVFQNPEPQFLCIEEPENGLHPKVIKELVNFFRSACEDYGHYIWLNTHSQTLVSQLQPEELILVDKINGKTQIKQFSKEFELHDFKMDDAWLTNALGGGLPW